MAYVVSSLRSTERQGSWNVKGPDDPRATSDGWWVRKKVPKGQNQMGENIGNCQAECSGRDIKDWRKIKKDQKSIERAFSGY